MPSRCLIIGIVASCISALDQALAAARHDDVDVFGMVISSPTAARSVVSTTCTASGGRPARGQAFLDQLRQRAVAMDRFRAAAQDRRIAALDAQAGSVHRDVRARFVDDADHAQRHPHLADLDAGRAELHVGDFADRVGQRQPLFQPFGHRRNALSDSVRRSSMAGARPAARAASDPTDWRRSNCAASRRIAAAIRVERAVLGGSVGLGHRARCCAGALADFVHVELDIHSA